MIRNIAMLHSDRFYLAMKDRWSSIDVEQDKLLAAQIRKLEKQYTTIYGDLPDWGNLITNIWDFIKKLDRGDYDDN
jgi:hypothetical protein